MAGRLELFCSGAGGVFGCVADFVLDVSEEDVYKDMSRLYID